jgi:hypothetical protein
LQGLQKRPALVVQSSNTRLFGKAFTRGETTLAQLALSAQQLPILSVGVTSDNGGREIKHVGGVVHAWNPSILPLSLVERGDCQNNKG